MPQLQQIATEKNVKKIVLGLPKHMHNEEGDKAEIVRAWGAKLAATLHLPVFFMDERLSTVAAQRVLTESNLSGRKKRQVVDKLAASIILQTWLDREKHLAQKKN